MSVTTHENQYQGKIEIRQPLNDHRVRGLRYVPRCDCGWCGGAQLDPAIADDQLLEHQVQVDREQAVWTPYR